MIRKILMKWCEENTVSLTEEQIHSFTVYAGLLREWNEKMNLTAITEPEEVAVKHFIDSLTILKCFDIPQNAKLIDIGTGAGFPGIPLKIMRPDLNLTLLDSLNKRLIFLDAVCQTLSLQAALIHARAEEYGNDPAYRDQFDIVVSRAVAYLPALCEYCMPYVRVGGRFIVMKGADGAQELKDADKAIRQLGGQLGTIQTLQLPDHSERLLAEIRKVSPTPKNYPRRGVKINKNPIIN